MAMSETLRPCPFCGADAHIIVFDGLTRVQCKRCGTSVGECEHRSEAVSFWNRRASDAQREAAEAMLAALEDAEPTVLVAAMLAEELGDRPTSSERHALPAPPSARRYQGVRTCQIV